MRLLTSSTAVFLGAELKEKYYGVRPRRMEAKGFVCLGLQPRPQGAVFCNININFCNSFVRIMPSSNALCRYKQLYILFLSAGLLQTNAVAADALPPAALTNIVRAF